MLENNCRTKSPAKEKKFSKVTVFCFFKFSCRIILLQTSRTYFEQLVRKFFDFLRKNRLLAFLFLSAENTTLFSGSEEEEQLFIRNHMLRIFG